jgi:hypothetical protein
MMPAACLSELVGFSVRALLADAAGDAGKLQAAASSASLMFLDLKGGANPRAPEFVGHLICHPSLLSARCLFFRHLVLPFPVPTHTVQPTRWHRHHHQRHRHRHRHPAVGGRRTDCEALLLRTCGDCCGSCDTYIKDAVLALKKH